MTVTSKKKNNQKKEKLELVDEGVINRGAINYHCDYCQVDIEDHRIRCNECEEFDLCVYCFTHGVEIAEHKNTHSYSIIKKHTFPIFDEKWGADEELLLLEAMEMYGIGSWADCADYIGSKTKEECCEHYNQIYMESQFCPLPDTTRDFDPDVDTFSNRKYHKPQTIKNKVWSSQPANHDVQGYMPGRLEFETEFDNDGENAIKEIAFHEEDNSDEVEFKLALLDAYNNKLNKREYRKRFLTERGFTEYKQRQNIERKRTKDEKLIYNGLKVFNRLQTMEDHELLCEGILLEEKLRAQIDKLQEYRRNGITSIADAEEYESLKEAREGFPKSSLPKDRSTMFAFEDGSLTLPKNAEISAPQKPTIESFNEKPRTIGRKPVQPLDISGADGIELLLDDEVKLCSALRLLPKAYLSIKEILIKECAIRGHLRRRQARSLVKIDVNKTARVYDFLYMMGWVRAHPAN